MSNTSTKPLGKELRVLICGDFLSSTNYKMLSWVAIAAQFLALEVSFILKPHPAYPVDLSDFSFLKLKISEAPLAELLTECNVVFTSNITSAAVDAYCSNTPLIQMLSGNNFNTSPLRGMKDIVYVTNPIELSVALNKVKPREQVISESYFFLDKELPRWRRLLGLNRVGVKENVGL